MAQMKKLSFSFDEIGNKRRDWKYKSLNIQWKFYFVQWDAFLLPRNIEKKNLFFSIEKKLSKSSQITMKTKISHKKQISGNMKAVVSCEVDYII